MLKTLIFTIMSVFGAASIAVAGMPITTMTVRPMTVRPEPHKNSGASTRTNTVTAMPHLLRPARLAVRVRKPDLIPVVKNPFDGVITVKNIGDGAARASKVLISCRKQGYAGSGDGCVDSPPALKQYDTSNGMAFPVQALRPGQSQQVNIPKLAHIPNLHSLPWQSGTYRFTVTADSGGAVAESNEGNNKVVTNMIAFRSVRMHVVRADITSRKGIRIGRRFSRWGGQLNLGSKDAIFASNGKCVFDVYYGMTNAGSAATSPAFVNRLREGAAVVSQQTALHLNAGQTKTIHTQAYLSPGDHIVSLSLDDGRVVAESNEGNNRFHVKVHVNNSCMSHQSAARKSGTPSLGIRGFAVSSGTRHSRTIVHGSSKQGLIKRFPPDVGRAPLRGVVSALPNRGKPGTAGTATANRKHGFVSAFIPGTIQTIKSKGGFAASALPANGRPVRVQHTREGKSGSIPVFIPPPKVFPPNAPYNLRRTSDLDVCAQQAGPFLPGIICKAAIRHNYAILVWKEDGCMPTPKIGCAKLAGFHVYERRPSGKLALVKTITYLDTKVFMMAPQKDKYAQHCVTVRSFTDHGRESKPSNTFCYTFSDSVTQKIQLKPTNSLYRLRQSTKDCAWNEATGLGLPKGKGIVVGKINTKGHCDYDNALYRGAVWFNVSQIPGNVTRARLQYRWESGEYQIAPDVAAGRVMISCATNLMLGSQDWRGNPWGNQPITIPGEDYAPLPHGSAPPDDKYDIDVTTAVQAWRSGARPNYGFVLRGPNENTAQDNGENRCVSRYGDFVLVVTYNSVP